MSDPSGREPDVEMTFDHDRHAPTDARHLLGDLMPDRDDPVAGPAALAASELVSNVVLHTADGGVFRAWDPRPDVPVRIEVEDLDPHLPEEHPDRGVGGRGLTIVAAVADAWGVSRTEHGGKVVWAEFDRTKHAPGKG
jgi:hypothetical protein